MTGEDLALPVGVPEIRLEPHELSALPVDAPGAPWRCRFEALVWWRVGGPATFADAARAVPAPLRRGVVPAMTVGALVRYADTPVGPYDEVLGAVVLAGRARPLVHVPFIAVDSSLGVVGARRNWALPKGFAQFSGAVRSGPPTSARGRSWAVEASPTWRGAPVPAPFPVLAWLAEYRGDGQRATSRVHGHARVRPARVVVRARGSFTSWFPTGRCWAAIIESGSISVGRARWTRP